MPARLALMTDDMELLAVARKLALADGHVVDLLPPDAPPPAEGTFAGVVVDLEPAARPALARKLFLNKLAKIAKALPVVVLDRNATYQEAAFLRAAGIRWLPTLDPRAFAAVLTHPLAKVAACDTEIELAEVAE